VRTVKNQDTNSQSVSFNFDEWADLYRRDPAAFEAKRQAVLAIEFAKCRTQSRHADQAGRMSLNYLDQVLEGRSAHERARISAQWMAVSAQQLSESLNRLAKLCKTEK
jgi:hypothetical protein